MKQEELLAALLGENFRNDGMVERFGGILRRDGARLIAIPEEMLARLLVADDADLKEMCIRDSPKCEGVMKKL